MPDDALVAIDPGWRAPGAVASRDRELAECTTARPTPTTEGSIRAATYFGVLELHLDADHAQARLVEGPLLPHQRFPNPRPEHHRRQYRQPDAGLRARRATPSTRLDELWLEQHLFNDKLAIRVGQLASDTEFVLSEGGLFFLNSTWEWLSSIAFDLPSGGPAYPFATPGVRVAVTPNDKFQLLAVLYNGDPAPPCASENPQVCNNNGLDFELDDPPLMMVEGAYKYSQDRLAGQVKLGGWNHFGTFRDQRFDIGGNLIAVTGLPGKPLDNDWGLYIIVDQLIWRLPGSKEKKGVALFGSVIGATPSDRNLVDFYAEAGITFSGMIPHRPEDILGIGVAYTGISDRVHAFDINSGLPVARNYEALLEICYTMQLAKGWTLQPDFQYIWQPGGNVPNPNGHGTVENAAVVGARTTLNF